MEIISKLPDKKQWIIGTKEIAKALKDGKIKKIVIASNCPDFLVEKLGNTDVSIERFSEDESQLGTKLGKPFPIAMVGYSD